MYRKLYLSGFAVYAALFALSIVFYKERTIFVDIAYHLFYIIKDNDFAIQNYRYGAAVTQVFPLMAYRLGLSLNTILVIYSAAFIIYYSFCYWLCGSVFKNYKIALALLLCNILFVSDTFYWIQSELPQGIACMMVLFAFVTRFENKHVNIGSALVLLLLITLANFFHPILIIPLMYVFIFLVVNKNIAVDKRLLFISAAYCLLVFMAKKHLFVAAYEQDAMKSADNVFYLYPHYFGLASNRRFLALCLEKYYWIPVSAAAIGIYYLLQRKWLLLLLFSGTFVGYLLLVNISYPHANETVFYMENLYLPLGIILSLPLAFDLLPAMKNRNVVYVLLAAVMLTGVVRIYRTHHVFTARLNWERNFLKMNSDRKLVIYSNKFLMDKLLMVWGTSYEFWLLSTIEQGKTASIMIHENPDRLVPWAVEKNSFITNWEVYHHHDFNPRYFKFKDTVNSYTVVR